MESSTDGACPGPMGTRAGPSIRAGIAKSKIARTTRPKLPNGQADAFAPERPTLGSLAPLGLQLLAQSPGFLLGLPQRNLQTLDPPVCLPDLQLRPLGPPLGFQPFLALPPHVLQALPAFALELLGQALRRFRRGAGYGAAATGVGRGAPLLATCRPFLHEG